MLDDLLHRLDRLLTSDAAEYVVAAAAILVWWLVSKTVYALRRDRGAGRVGAAPDEPRPRRRIPLY